MAEHHVAVTVNAPVHQVYALFTHFNDYPKFMTYVKEVTYLDDHRSHWVVDMLGSYEWDAVNEDWIPDRQIGWRSVSGLVNSGRVVFAATSGNATDVQVAITYEPPGGILGTIGEALVAGAQFERRLQHDLDHFAEMVAAAPRDSLDPASSTYLFHAKSAAAMGKTTDSQDQTMGAGETAGIGSILDPPSTTSVTSAELE